MRVASLFVRDPGLALVAKMCPDQSQAFKEVKNSLAFTIGRKKILVTNFFLDEPFPGVPRHVCTKFRVNINSRRTDRVRAGPAIKGFRRRIGHARHNFTFYV